MEEINNPNRRDFLSGRALQRQIAEAGEILADSFVAATDGGEQALEGGPTLRLGREAMACDFEVVLNPGPVARLDAASCALDLIGQLEDQLSVYQPQSEVSLLNADAPGRWVEVEPRLFELLWLARQMGAATDGGLDITTGPLITLWRQCRTEYRLPTEAELIQARSLVGISKVEFDAERHAVRFPVAGMELNLGSIGKGYALDRAAEMLAGLGMGEFLLHGGKSSLLARGGHNNQLGWPVGIANPLFPEKTLATILLVDAGLSTSGANIQYFRLEGKRYGHILDPRTGWPAEGLASVTVIAPTAALAEALSTAFFVIGVENARQYCHNHPEVKALLIPAPEPGQRLRIVNCGLPADALYLSGEVG